jgi:hypothetical protein
MLPCRFAALVTPTRSRGGFASELHPFVMRGSASKWMLPHLLSRCSSTCCGEVGLWPVWSKSNAWCGWPPIRLYEACWATPSKRNGPVPAGKFCRADLKQPVYSSPRGMDCSGGSAAKTGKKSLPLALPGSPFWSRRHASRNVAIHIVRPTQIKTINFANYGSRRLAHIIFSRLHWLWSTILLIQQ